MFDENFRVCFADTPFGVALHQRIRYQVFCLDKGFEDPGAFSATRETDAWDARSAHFIVQDLNSRQWVAATRLVLPRPQMDLPVQKTADLHATLCSDLGDAVGEISRFCIISQRSSVSAQTGSAALAATRPSPNSLEEWGIGMVSKIEQVSSNGHATQRVTVRFPHAGVKVLSTAHAELTRVTRPGGRVVLANWTRRGFIGQLLTMHGAFVPPPAEIPSPLLWADESVLRERFDEHTWRLTWTTRTLTFRYPHTPAGTAELFRAAYGPTVRAFAVLDEDGRASFAADLAEHWSWHQHGRGTSTEVDAEYLEVVAVRR